MAVKLSPVLNWQNFDANGNPLSGGKIYTYLAGSTTPAATYTTIDGTDQQANPIILNTRGEVDQPIWLTEGQAYKFILKDANDNTIGVPWDNISGVNEVEVQLSQWQSSGDSPTYLTATTFSVPGDRTTDYQANRRIKLLVSSGTVYGYIVSSVFGAATTVTVSLDSGTLDAGLSSVELGIITPLNTSLPKIPNWIDSAMLQDDLIIPRLINDSALGIPLINGVLTASVAGNALTIAIKTKAGTDPASTDPVLAVFRNATLTNGTYVVRSITSALSVTVSSGSTLGTTDAVQSQVDVLLYDNAGTVGLAIVNDAGAPSLDEQSLISTTAEGGAGGADSASVIYSGSAVSNVPYRFIGYVVSTQATAGTWATAPSKLQLINALFPKGKQSVLRTMKTETAVTFIDFLDIPSWAKKITIQLNAFSLSGSDNIIVQIGDSGGVEITGYRGSGSEFGVSALTTANETAGWRVTTGAPAGSTDINGQMVLTLMDSATNLWMASGSFGRSSSASMYISAGAKNLSAALDRVRVTTIGGVVTIDAGSVNIMYE